jgi:2-desacetyl-2-hydroxyethyl bacteriochlorophyllide A dehydrogenase
VKAVQLQSIGKVAFTEVPDPEPNDGEVLVRVTAAGMCGSDRHLVSGEYPGSPPVVLGHEFEGVVVSADLGSLVKVGDRVTVDPNIPCGACENCTRGLVAHCVSLSAYGVDRDGGFADFARVKASQLYVLPRELEEYLGAFSEPISCCLRAMDLAVVQPGYRVAVVGGGVMGQLLVQLARLAGATEVILSTRQLERRALAETLGASASIDPTARDIKDAVSGLGGLAPGGVDVVFDAAGAPGSLEQAVAIVRPAGSVIVVGAAPQEMVTQIHSFDIFQREIRIQGSHLNPFTHGRAAQLVASGVLRLEPLITRVVGLGELTAALQRSPERGEVKVIAVP